MERKRTLETEIAHLKAIGNAVLRVAEKTEERGFFTKSDLKGLEKVGADLGFKARFQDKELIEEKITVKDCMRCGKSFRAFFENQKVCQDINCLFATLEGDLLS